MNANLIQARLIERYAARHGMHVEAAAMVWIRKNGRKFRAWFSRHAV
jgi:hypothetical protein